MAAINQSPQAGVYVLNRRCKPRTSSNVFESADQPIVVTVRFFEAKRLNAIFVESFEISYGLVTQLVAGHSFSAAS